ncbi:hypothetical protein S7711_11514 [Stachybotrys chartarum IBT 7711]|uniref:Uncharacterized protein n=1 Tax=Stachybotrys chartarum (strain CBS 109288 / IBT 7711) TaxID=1280523 RepID=A0A084B524_STACB|nr:hypothetical protein S7711_11514 [Stachybotrys chartarum IBT 7711]
MLKASNGAGACFCSNNHSAQVTTAKCRARPNTKLDKVYFERKGARTWNVPEASVKELFEKTGINIAKEAIIKLGRFQFEHVKTELISLSKGGRLRKDHINQATHNLDKIPQDETLECQAKADEGDTHPLSPNVRAGCVQQIAQPTATPLAQREASSALGRDYVQAWQHLSEEEMTTLLPQAPLHRRVIAAVLAILDAAMPQYQISLSPRFSAATDHRHAVQVFQQPDESWITYTIENDRELITIYGPCCRDISQFTDLLSHENRDYRVKCAHVCDAAHDELGYWFALLAGALG